MECRDRKMMQATLTDELHYRIGQLADPAAGDCLSLLGLLTKLTFELEDEVTRPVTNQSLTMLYDGLGRLIGRRNANSPACAEYVALNGAIHNYTQTMALLVGWEFGPVTAPCECAEAAPAEPPCECTEEAPAEPPCECVETAPGEQPPTCTAAADEGEHRPIR